MNKKVPPLMGLPPDVELSKLMEGRAERAPARPSSAARDALRKEAVQEALNRTAPDSGMRLTSDTEIDDSWAEIPVMAIAHYELNPRKANNAAYAELKESIREQGILQPLTVTRRPGDAGYMLYAGGNTRLQIVKELWQETGDERFRKTRVITKAWRGEASVMLAHMAENTQRSDMTFWDKANGMHRLRQMLDAEKGKSLSLREFEDELKKFGMSADIRSTSMYRFAIEAIPSVGPWLTGLSLRRIQPHLNLSAKLANHFDVEQSDYFQRVVDPVSSDLAEELAENPESAFSVDTYLDRCDLALAKFLEVERSVLGKMLATLEHSKGNATIEDLLKHKETRPKATPKVKSPTASSEPLKRELTGRPQPTASLSASAAPDAVGDDDIQDHPPAVADQASIAQAMPASSLRRLAEKLVVAAEIGSCYYEAPGMPHGFYVGFSPNGPVDLLGDKLDATSRQIAWWILACASGQFSPEACKSGLPEHDEWRQLILGEGQESLQACEVAIQHHVGADGEFMPMTWLFDPSNPIGDLCLEIVALSRKGGAKW